MRVKAVGVKHARCELECISKPDLQKRLEPLAFGTGSATYGWLHIDGNIRNRSVFRESELLMPCWMIF